MSDIRSAHCPLTHAERQLAESSAEFSSSERHVSQQGRGHKTECSRCRRRGQLRHIATVRSIADECPAVGDGQEFVETENRDIAGDAERYVAFLGKQGERAVFNQRQAVYFRELLHLADRTGKSGVVNEVQRFGLWAYPSFEVLEIDFKLCSDSIKLHMSAGIDQRFNFHTVVIRRNKDFTPLEPQHLHRVPDGIARKEKVVGVWRAERVAWRLAVVQERLRTKGRKCGHKHIGVRLHFEFSFSIHSADASPREST